VLRTCRRRLEIEKRSRSIMIMVIDDEMRIEGGEGEGRMCRWC
jgi:hypothetical protein